MNKEQNSEGNNIVIIAGYQSIEPAKNNFDQLTQLAKDKKIKTEGMILVEKDKEGKVSVTKLETTSAEKGWAGAAVSDSWWGWPHHHCWELLLWAL